MDTYLSSQGFTHIVLKKSKGNYTSYGAIYQDSDVFVKVFSDSQQYSSTCAKRDNESCCLLSTANILQLRKSWKDNVSGCSYTFLLFEGYVRTLKEEIIERATQHWYWGEAQLISFANQLTDTCLQASQHGIAHRNIKPSNIVRDQCNKFKLTGFHGAKVFSDMNTAVTDTLSAQVYFPADKMKEDLFASGFVLLQMSTLTLLSKNHGLSLQGQVTALSMYGDQLKQLLRSMLHKNQTYPMQVAIGCEHYPDPDRIFVHSPCHGYICSYCFDFQPGPTWESSQFSCTCSPNVYHPIGTDFISKAQAPCLKCGEWVAGTAVQLPCGDRFHSFCSDLCFKRHIEESSMGFTHMELAKCPICSGIIPQDVIEQVFGGRDNLIREIENYRRAMDMCIRCNTHFSTMLIHLPCGHKLCQLCRKSMAFSADYNSNRCPNDGIIIPKQIIEGCLSQWGSVMHFIRNRL